jgi:signal transduction histidine kinase
LNVPFEDDPFLAVAIETRASDGPVIVIAGRTLETVTESTAAVVSLLAFGLPLVLLVVVAVTWRVVGRALAPVEEIRGEVEAISTKDLHRRVPNPTGSDEVARLARTMNEMLARLQRGRLRERRFVSDASHELRSPIASIRQHSEVALAHPESTEVKELAEVVLAEGSRLQRLVEDLLLLARSDEGTLPDATETIDLDDLLFAEAERLRGAPNLTVDTTGVSGGRVRGNKAQLERVVRNLIENAARHARGRIAVSLRETGDEVVLTVDDDGDGVPPAQRQLIFERFVRLDGARARDAGGSGLGLAIVAEVAARHGGRVSATDAPGRGARFEVRLPRQA